MVWQEPKENWALGDAPNDGDFNRIEGNILFLNLLRGAAGGVASLGGDKKVPLAELPTAIAAQALKLVQRDTNGRAQISDPVEAKDITNKQWVETKIAETSNVEVATIRDITSSIAADGTLTKTITFKNIHKIALIGIEGSSLFGAIGFVLSSNLEFDGPLGLFVSHYSLTKTTTENHSKIGGIAGLPASGGAFSGAEMFGSWIEMNTPVLNNKTVTLTFTNRHQTQSNVLKANVNIVGI